MSQDQTTETPPADVVARDHVVHGRAGDLLVTLVTDLELGARGELILKGVDGGVVAIVAHDHWWHVRVADEPAAEEVP